MFRDVIQNEDLAAESPGRVERDPDLNTQATPVAIHTAVERKDTHSA